MEDWKDGRDKRFQPSRLLQKINFYRAETEFFCVKSSCHPQGLQNSVSLQSAELVPLSFAPVVLEHKLLY